MKTGNKIISKQDIRDARLHDEDQSALSSIEEIIADIKAGKPVVLVDDEDRENEGDLVIAAECASAEAINFMAKEGRGLICLPMERAMIERLGLELMGRGDNTNHRTAFTVSIEAKEGVTTGISAADRAHTIQTAINPQTRAHDIATPGHVFPLLARDGGVLVRAGHTEAAVDLAKMAGFSGAGVICEVMNDDGSMARLNDLIAFSQKHNIKIGTIADLIAYRRRTENMVARIYEDEFINAKGVSFKMHVYEDTLHKTEHIALFKGDIQGGSDDGSSDDAVLVRMHAVNILDDILGRKESDLHKAMDIIADKGCGALVILRNPEADIVSVLLGRDKQTNKKQDNKELALRRYGIGAQILLDLGISNMILLSDHPKPVAGLDGYGLSIAGYHPLSKQE